MMKECTVQDSSRELGRFAMSIPFATRVSFVWYIAVSGRVPMEVRLLTLFKRFSTELIINTSMSKINIDKVDEGSQLGTSFFLCF